MKIDIVELLGIIAAIIVLISMCFNANTFRGNVYMRTLNLMGSIAYVVYGIALRSISLILLNGVLIFVHIYYLYLAYKMSKGGIKAFKKRQKEQMKHVRAYKKRKK